MFYFILLLIRFIYIDKKYPSLFLEELSIASISNKASRYTNIVPKTLNNRLTS